MSMVADLTKHLFSLGPEAIEEIAAILQVTVAPSTTTKSTTQSKFLTAYKYADAIKKSLFTRGIAHYLGIPLCYSADLERLGSDHVSLTR